MSSSTIFTIIEAIWNGNANHWDITGFINAIFSYEPKETQAFLQMLPRTWLKENLWYANPVTLRQLNQKLMYVYKKIVENKTLTPINLWVIDSYFNLFNNDELREPHQYHQTFERYKLENRMKMFELFSTLHMIDNNTNVNMMSEMWIGNFIRELAREKKAADFNRTLEIINELTPGDIQYTSGPSGRVQWEIIKITDSSWLVKIEYDNINKIARFTTNRSIKTYDFYNVPRVAVSFVEVNRGQEMWNGFGLRYSINPTHWIRKNTFLYYEKRQHFDNLKAGYTRPSIYRNTYKRKRKGKPS